MEYRIAFGRCGVGCHIASRVNQVNHDLSFVGNRAHGHFLSTLDCTGHAHDEAVAGISGYGRRLVHLVNGVGIVSELRVFGVDIRVNDADFRPADADGTLHHLVTGKPEATVALADLLVHGNRNHEPGRNHLVIQQALATIDHRLVGKGAFARNILIIADPFDYALQTVIRIPRILVRLLQLAIFKQCCRAQHCTTKCSARAHQGQFLPIEPVAPLSQNVRESVHHGIPEIRHAHIGIVDGEVIIVLCQDCIILVLPNIQGTQTDNGSANREIVIFNLDSNKLAIELPVIVYREPRSRRSHRAGNNRIAHGLYHDRRFGSKLGKRIYANARAEISTTVHIITGRLVGA